MKYIGIDPGTQTGVAIWDALQQSFTSIRTLRLHQALKIVHDCHLQGPVKVFVEDPNTWVPFKKNKSSAAKIQGAGSIKRDFAIWSEFCEDHGIPMVRTRIQGTMKKVNPGTFQIMTKFRGVTSSHGRDAAMLVFGMSNNRINLPKTVSI